MAGWPFRIRERNVRASAGRGRDEIGQKTIDARAACSCAAGMVPSPLRVVVGPVSGPVEAMTSPAAPARRDNFKLGRGGPAPMGHHAAVRLIEGVETGTQVTPAERASIGPNAMASGGEIEALREAAREHRSSV